jgi:hypothetical protein
MGMYTGVATRIKIKKTAPAHVIEFFDHLYGQGPEVKTAPARNQAQKDLKEAVSTIQNMLNNISSYFEAWCWSVKEDKGDYWLYESRASTKTVSHDLFIMMLMGVTDSLVLEPGDILMRAIYEESAQENLVYVVSVDPVVLEKRVGMEFEHERGVVIDYRHPCNYKLRGEDREKDRAGTLDYKTRHDFDDFTFPWTIIELEEKIADEKKERLKKLRQRYMH